MAVSASAAFFVVMLVVASVATSLTAIAMMMVSATAASACQMFDQVLYLLLSGITILVDDTSEVERLASQRVVGIHCHWWSSVSVRVMTASG